MGMGRVPLHMPRQEPQMCTRSTTRTGQGVIDHDAFDVEGEFVIRRAEDETSDVRFGGVTVTQRPSTFSGDWFTVATNLSHPVIQQPEDGTLE